VKWPRHWRRFYIVHVVRGTRRVCNKRPLQQPASNSYCGSAQREPYNPFNRGRAEKAGGYSSRHLFVLASTPRGTPLTTFIPRLRGSRQCQGAPSCRDSWEESLGVPCLFRAFTAALPAASRTAAKWQPQSHAEGSVLAVVSHQTLADGSIPRKQSYSSASAGRRRALTNPPADFLKAVCTADRSKPCSGEMLRLLSSCWARQVEGKQYLTGTGPH